MIYFILKTISYLIIILLTYYLFNKKEITILETIILLFIFNICLFSLYNNINLIYTSLIVLISLLIYYLYNYLYKKSLNKKIYNTDKVLINRGLINFQELIKEKITYESLILSLKKKGINNPNLVDYCIKKGNDLVIFQSKKLKNYPISIIIDGNILYDNLNSINKNYEWLNNKINDNDLDIHDINYAFYKDKEIYFLTNN